MSFDDWTPHTRQITMVSLVVLTIFFFIIKQTEAGFGTLTAFLAKLKD